MLAERKIKAGDIVRDIRSRMSDADLMEKYQLSAAGLQSLFKQILAGGVMQPFEIYGRAPSYDHAVILENNRDLPRTTVFFHLPIMRKARADVTGRVQDITEQGLRASGIQADEGETVTLVIPAQDVFMVDTVELEAVCRWTRSDETGAPVAGFEISRINRGDLPNLIALLKSLPFEDRESPELEYLHGDEDSTETVDLANVFIEDVSSSGSFSFRGVTQTWFGQLLQALPVLAFLIDQSGKITFANKACGAVSPNYRAVVGRPFGSVFPNDSECAMARSMLAGVFEFRKHVHGQALLEIDDVRVYGRISLRSIRLGETRSVLMLVEDLTAEQERLRLKEDHNERLRIEIADRRRAEEALRESEEKYRTIIENIEEGYFEVDPAGNMVLCNDSLARILGYSREELSGMNNRRYMDRETAPRVFRFFNEVYRTGVASDSFEFELIRKDGSRRSVETSVSLVRNAEGEAVGFRGICRDITEQKRAEQERLRMEKLESLGILAGGIAHDFNNILAAILGNISLARMYWNSEDKLKERLTEAEKACSRAQGLTQQLLTFSRGGAPVKKLVNVGRLIEECCSFALRGSNVRCEFQFDRDLAPVEIDEGQIAQVINNLVINGAQAMPAGGVIRVSGINVTVRPDEPGPGPGPAPPGRYIRISLTDHGAGIPKEIQSKIFDPYFTTKVGGSGLGLATSFSIVTNHDGAITVESEESSGSTFHIYLPASGAEIDDLDETEEVLFTGKGRILIMDDEEQIRSLAAETLRYLGYKAVAVKDGADAIDAYHKARESGEPFDAVLLDLTVPGGMGGKETVRQLLEIDPKVQAVVSSGFSNDPVMADYRRYGFVDVVTKPYTVHDLSEVLARVISGADIEDHT